MSNRAITIAFLCAACQLAGVGCIEHAKSTKGLLPNNDLKIDSGDARIAGYGRLDYHEKTKLIRHLSKSKDVSSLSRIAASGLEGSDMAISTLIATMSADAAIQYCRSVENDPVKWADAFWGLASHERDGVINYVVEVAQRKDAKSKWLAYKICYARNWPDLVAYCESDFDDDSRVFVLNQSPDELTVGQLARRYFHKLKREQSNQRS